MDNLPDTPIKGSQIACKPSKPINKGITKTKKKTPPAQKHARRTPTINNLAGLSKDQKLLLQHHIIEPTYYRDGAGRKRAVTVKRKIYFFCRLIGNNHTKALNIAGYRRYRSMEYMVGDGGASGALKTYWDTNGLNLEYILDRLCTLVEKGQNENSRVRALKLLSELKGYYTTRSVVDINEHLQVNFSMSGPVICPHCNGNTLHPPAAGSQLSPGQAPAIPAEVIEGEYVTT